MGKSKLIIIMALLLTAVCAQAAVVTDALGRKVEVPDKINRIVALGSSMAFVSYLNCQNMVVGVEDFDKREKFVKPYIYLNRELVKDLPVVAKGGPGRMVMPEQVIRVKPDVVFLNSLDKAEAEMLQRKLNIPVVGLSYGLPAFDIITFYDSIRVTAKVLKKEKRAEELVGYIDRLLKDLDSAPEKQVKAYIGGISFKGFHGLDSTSADFIPFKMADITNAADTTGKKGQIFVSKEFVLASNPEMIFIDGNSLPLVEEDIASNPAYYARLKAFSSGKVYLVVPDTSYFVNPELMFANAFLMAKAAYPQNYKNIDPVKKADEILTMFFGKPLYAELEKDSKGYKKIDIKDGRMVLKEIEKK
ncbi:MAG: ABC transporter substrate-binding protein [Deferribacterales bacterium]